MTLFLTLFIVVCTLIVLMTNTLSPDIVLLGSVIVLALCGIITPEEAFHGFSNTGMITIAGLFVVGTGLRRTGVVEYLTSYLLGQPKTERGALSKLVAVCTLGSAFLNNTTIVATFMPAIYNWSRRIHIAPSKLLIPLSFATILGGTCTLIGTSTNLVVAGMIDDLLLSKSHQNIHALSMFSITPIGISVSIVGGILIVLLGPIVLPNRKKAISVEDDPKQYTMELLIPSHSALVGLSVEKANLRHLPGAFLMEIIRDTEVITAVDSQQRLSANDRLIFVGDITAIVELQHFAGLSVAEDQIFKLSSPRNTRTILEAVVSPTNPLIGKSIRDSGFRNQYQAVVIAVARAGEKIRGKIGDIVLQSGDVLLLEAEATFLENQKKQSHFILISSVENATPPRSEKAWIAGLILLALVVTISLNLLNSAIATCIAAGCMIATKCCTLEEARGSLDLVVLICIASSFGLGLAIHNSGADTYLVQHILSMGIENPAVALILVYICTTLLTELITNNAAAIIAFPFALSLAEQLHVSPMGFFVAVMFAASMSFLSPIGYQTNLMVFTLGGYKASDYPKLGLPLSILVGIITTTLIPLFWPL